MTNVTLAHQNVCKDGFTIVDTADAGNHSQLSSSFCLPGWRTDGFFATKVNDGSLHFTVFLDLPAPWEAIQHAKSALRVRQSPLSGFLTALPY